MNKSKDRLHQLLEKAETQDKAELTILHNASIAAMGAYKTSSTASDLKDWQAAKRALSDCIDELWPRYFNDGKTEAKNEFKNRTDAHQYLVDRGHEITYRTFTNACKRGDCKVEKNGKTILLSSLLDYIDDHLGPVVIDSEKMSKQKLQQEIDINTEKLKKMQLANREADKAWMLVADHDQQVAALVGVVFDIVARELEICMDDIIMVTGIESTRRAELAAIIKERVDTAKLALSAAPEFEVVFGESESEEVAA